VTEAEFLDLKRVDQVYLVAEHVMGWDEEGVTVEVMLAGWDPIWSMNDAFEVVKKLLAVPDSSFTLAESKGDWYAFFPNYMEKAANRAIHSDPGVAICLAALKAKGVVE